MKDKVVTFKVSDEIWDKLDLIENKSEFIRNAVLSKIEESCPLCLGLGKLNEKQIEHLNLFLENHKIIKAQCCNENILTCINQK